MDKKSGKKEKEKRKWIGEERLVKGRIVDKVKRDPLGDGMAVEPWLTGKKVAPWFWLEDKEDNDVYGS